MNAKDIGMKIKEIRNHRGLTRKDIANHIGIHYSSVTKWENGETTPADQHKVELSRLLEVKVEELFYR